jgi:Spy/CpxP family protein refolding chaperone
MLAVFKSLSLALLAFLFTFSWTLEAADSDSAKAKDAQSTIISMRLKSLTKNLELTDEQQKKISAMLTEEAKSLEKLRTDGSIPVKERYAKVRETQQATYTKMKPVLTEPQREKFEKMLAALNKPKKN